MTLEGSYWLVSIILWAARELTLATLGHTGTAPGAHHRESRLAGLYPWEHREERDLLTGHSRMSPDVEAARNIRPYSRPQATPLSP